MDNIYHNLTSFLAIWFRNLQKSTYNVNVVNKEADRMSPPLFEKLQQIHFLLQDLGGKELKVKVSNQKELNTKELENRLGALLSGVKDINLDNSGVERLLSDLVSVSKGVKKVEVLNQPSYPDKMSIAGKVEVSNFPKIQEVKGDLNMKEAKDILKGLQELADEIRDLKLESIQGYKNMGNVLVGSAGSRESHKLTDGTKTATITASGDSNALDVNIVAGGTNAIGKLLAPDIDVTAHTNYAKKYYTNAGAVTDGIVWSPAAGKRWHAVVIHFQVSADCTVTLEDDKAGGDEVVWKGEYKAGSGHTLTFSEKYPLASGEDAADLLITTSAGNIYLLAVGYEV